MVPFKLLPLRRVAWKPVTTEGDGSPTASKFSGTPWLAADEPWPTCPNCGRPMPLFLQLNLDELPGPAREEYGDGLLQLFYCTSQEPLCEVDCEAFFPFSESVLVRIVRPGPGATARATPEVGGAFPPRLVTGWETAEDYPHPYEAEELGVALSEEEWDRLQEEGGEIPLEGDKLGGWPAWVQGVEYPACPRCGAAMGAVFQVASGDNLPYIFGDLGTGHVTQCPEHKEEVAFGWACT